MKSTISSYALTVLIARRGYSFMVGLSSIALNKPKNRRDMAAALFHHGQLRPAECFSVVRLKLFDAYLQRAVRRDFEHELNLGHASGPRADARQREPAEAATAADRVGVSFEEVDADGRLVVFSRRVNLRDACRKNSPLRHKN